MLCVNTVFKKLASFKKTVVLAGGVGGARFLQGLTRILPPDRLDIIGNVGDDIELYGLHISPDLDTVMYTIAGLVDEEKGWGLKKDSFNFLQMFKHYDCRTWFKIGDMDVATHIFRTFLIQKGLPLSEVTKILCHNLGVKYNIIPVTDDKVRTKVDTKEGLLDFQEYFVKKKFEVEIRKVIFEGANDSIPNSNALKVIEKAQIIIFAPSNPIVSIGCILSVPGIKEAIKRSKAYKVAISPIIGGKAVRGPAHKMMKELGNESSSFGVAAIYKELINVMIIDNRDVNLKTSINDLGMSVIVTNTLMSNMDSKINLARLALNSMSDVQS
ncbi:2-phospho-L-lactate transferase [Candidatus Bathyarchaeota archaeon RBG_13_38_9]|nr:MAG: 2-phospho-L-lactate transferase [Candidatus Bathyarchaeota archaeon RBG_13_38_9]